MTLDSTDTIKVSWNKVKNADGYYIYYRRPSIYQIIVNGHEIDNTPYEFYKATTSTSIKMKDMGYGRKYDIKVQPYGLSDRKKVLSDNYTIETISTLRDLQAPSRITVSSTGKTTAMVSWKKVTNAKGYYVYLKKNNADSYDLYKTTTGTSISISKLRSKTQYRVKIVPYGIRNDVKVKSDHYISKKFGV